MTTIFTIFFETLSDNLLLAAIICFANILYSNNENLFSTHKKQIIISILVSCVLSIVFNRNFFEQIVIFKWILILTNFFKYVFLTAFVYKKFNAGLIITSLIIQFLCSNITAALLVFIPVGEIESLYILNIVLHLFVRLIALLIVLHISRKYNHGSIRNLISIIPSYTFVLVVLSLCLSNGLIQTANFNTEKVAVQIYITKIFASLITICMTVILLTLLFNVISKKYQSDINNVLEKQIATQLYHYEQLEKMNAETRRFKHDYINHMKCISYMALNQEYDNILNYIGKLSAAFPASSFLFETGNYIADAILTEKQANSPDNISIQFDGVIPTDIDNTDLCIILSNAIDNAVEACCSYGGDKIINVYGGFKHGYFVFKIKNPTANTNLNDKITTTKSDKINHGFGLDNIKRALKKYDGYLSTSCEDNVFTINITFSGLSGLKARADTERSRRSHKTQEDNSAEAEKVEK